MTWKRFFKIEFWFIQYTKLCIQLFFLLNASHWIKLPKMFANIFSAFTIIVSFILTLNVTDPTSSQLKLTLLFTTTLVLHIDCYFTLCHKEITNKQWVFNTGTWTAIFLYQRKQNIQISPIHHS